MAYYYIPKEHRNKLKPKAAKGIFTGYSNKRRAYRVYNPEDNEMREVRTAKFDENSKGAELLDGNFQDSSMGDLEYQPESHVVVDDDDEDFIPEVEFPPPNDPQPPLQGNDQQERQAPGRKPGVTNEMLEIRHKIKMMKREERMVDEGARRSERLKVKHQANNTENRERKIPESYKEAIESQYSDEWKAAMEEEIQSLKSHNVWKLTPQESDMKVINSKWVFNIKEDPNGTIQRRKARLVPVGYNQRPGVDFEASFAPVMKMESFRTLIALASQLGLKIRQYDVKTAYLYGNLEERVYMKQPERFIKPGDEEKVCELQKSLYGLPQSGRCWNEKLNKVLTDIGMHRIESDPCIYIFQLEEKIMIMGVYVDDLLTCGTDDIIMDEIMGKVIKRFEMTRVDKPIFFLGVEVKETAQGYTL